MADASPLHYLVLIGAVAVLEPLYERVLVPPTVESELLAANTPPPVRKWMAQLPAWCEVRSDPPLNLILGFLDKGEHAAISLAISINADTLLIDERVGAPRRYGVRCGSLGRLEC